MILASHIIAASAIAAPLALKSLTISNSAAIFLVSFISHYLLDSIPHWDYKLSSLNFNKKGNKEIILNKKLILRDLAKISFDGILGLGIGFYIIGLSADLRGILAMGLIIFASCLPDALEIGYAFWKKFPFNQLQKFHSFFHAKLKLNNQPVKGIAIQAIVLLILIVLFI